MFQQLIVGTLLSYLILTLATGAGFGSEKRIPEDLGKLSVNRIPIPEWNQQEYEHHDPSNIVRYEGHYYCWYTEHPRKTSGWDSDAYIRCMRSVDGVKWKDIGIAIPTGEKGSLDDEAAITAYIVPHDDNYYLFYTALGSEGGPGITYAVAESPEGPWVKSGNKLLWPSGNESDWDGTHNDDTNIIFYRGKWYLYYKGKPLMNGERTSANTRVGVAISENLLGPYEKYENNPVFPGHAFTAWINGDGVAAIGYGTFWSEDGIHFEKVSDWSPDTSGIYHPPSFDPELDRSSQPSWGLEVVKGQGARHIRRIEFKVRE